MDNTTLGKVARNQVRLSNRGECHIVSGKYMSSASIGLNAAPLGKLT